MSKTASSIIKTAKSYKGKGGWTFQKAYGVPKGTAWCGIFVWYIFNKCGASDIFLEKKKNPAYVPNIFNWGKEKKLTVNKSKAKKGDIVIFDWGNDGTKDHVGFIVENKGKGVYKTIEGNTSGGKVAERERYTKDICMIIRPKYITEEKKETTKKKYTGKFPTSVVNASTGTKKNIKRWQKFLKWCGYYNDKIDGSFGANTISGTKKFQKKVGITQDGSCGTNTLKKAKAYKK